jgi:predicted RNA-binding Zn ribbon-like protein
MTTLQFAPIAVIHPQGHAHVADLETCLDFINSESFDDGVPDEHLATPDDAIAWFATRGLTHEEAVRAQAMPDAAAWLGRVRGVRAALRHVWDAEVDHRIPDQWSLETVNAVLREAPRIELVAGNDCCGIGHRHTADDPTGEALASVVQPLVNAIAAGDTGRFRVCANDGCRWVFEDTSRAGRRRWCDMTTCGNRAKARRFRSKRKGEGEVEADDEPGRGVGGADACAADACGPDDA